MLCSLSTIVFAHNDSEKKRQKSMRATRVHVARLVGTRLYIYASHESYWFPKSCPKEFQTYDRFVGCSTALGRSWASFGPLLATLGPVLAALGPILAALGPLMAALGPFLWHSWLGHVFTYMHHTNHTGFQRAVQQSFKHMIVFSAVRLLLAALRHSWAALGRSWANLGRSLAAHGCSWAVLGRSGGALGRS